MQLILSAIPVEKKTINWSCRQYQYQHFKSDFNILFNVLINSSRFHVYQLRITQPWHTSTCHEHCLQHNGTRVDDTVVKELHRTFGNTMNRRWQEVSLLLTRKMDLGQYKTIGDNWLFKHIGLNHDSNHVCFHIMQIWQVIARRQESYRQYRGIISALIIKILKTSVV